jgi:hypothetical protein
VSWKSKIARRLRRIAEFIDPTQEDDDLCGCEQCGARIEYEDAAAMGDCYFCQECAAKWRAHFDSCAHVWEPWTDEMGDAGRVCTKCNGFVADELQPSGVAP